MTEIWQFSGNFWFQNGHFLVGHIVPIQPSTVNVTMLIDEL